MPVEKKKDGADWADECDEEDTGRRERSSSIGSAPKDLLGGETQERQMLRGSSGNRGGLVDRSGDRGYDQGRGGFWDSPTRGYGRDSGFGGRDRLDPSQIRERWGGKGGYDRSQIREGWGEQPGVGARPGDFKILRSGEDPVCERSQRSLSLGDSRESMKEANDAMAALAVEREQLKNEDANPRRIEDGNNPPSDRPRSAAVRPCNLHLSSSHDPHDQVFLAMAAKRMQAQQEISPKAMAPNSPVVIMKRPTEDAKEGGNSNSAKMPQGKSSPGAVASTGKAALETSAQKSPQLKAAPGNPAKPPSPQQSPQQPQHQPPHHKLGQQQGSPVGTPEELEARRRAQALEKLTPKVLTRPDTSPQDKSKPQQAAGGKKSTQQPNASTSEVAQVEGTRQTHAHEQSGAKASVRHDTSAHDKSKERGASMNKPAAQASVVQNDTGAQQQKRQDEVQKVETPSQEALSIAMMKEKKREMMESRQVEMMAQTHNLSHLHHHQQQQQYQYQQQFEIMGRRHRDTRCLGAKAPSAGPARPVF